MNPHNGNPLYLKECAVAACARPARNNANGSVVCHMHYQRWKKYGVFSLPPRIESCIAEGCGRPTRHKTEGLCDMHYARRHRGSPRGDAPKPSSCLHCANPLEQKRGTTVFYCGSSCAAKHSRGAPLFVNCTFCQSPFRRQGGAENYCSAPCREYGRAETKRWNARSNQHIKRAREHAVPFERFDTREIYERDGWTCQLCKKPVDKALRHPDPLSVSLDHHVPLGMGGPHSRANVQCTHLACNLAKARHDIGAIAKAKRLAGNTQYDKRKRAGPKLKAGRPLQSRGFDKSLRKRMDGSVVKRDA